MGERRQTIDRIRKTLIRVTDANIDSSPDAVRRIINATRPTEVRVDEISCGPVSLSGLEALHYQLNRLEPSFALANDGLVLLVRLPHVLQCLDVDEEDEELDGNVRAEIRVTHLAAFSVLDDLETCVEALSAWIETNVYFLVYPYVRQIMTTLTGELGLPPVLLDYMHRDERPYSRPSVDPTPELRESAD